MSDPGLFCGSSQVAMPETMNQARHGARRADLGQGIAGQSHQLALAALETGQETLGQFVSVQAHAHHFRESLREELRLSEERHAGLWLRALLESKSPQGLSRMSDDVHLGDNLLAGEAAFLVVNQTHELGLKWKIRIAHIDPKPGHAGFDS